MEYQSLVERFNQMKIRYQQLKKTNEQLEQTKFQAAKTIEQLEMKLSNLHEEFEKFQRNFQIESEMKIKQLRDELKSLNFQSEEQLKVQEKIRLENDETFGQVSTLFAAAAALQKKTQQYEQQIEMILIRTHEQLKSIEDEFIERNNKQEMIISDQQKTIRLLKEEQNQMKIFWEKQLNSLKLKKEQLEKKFSRLNQIHQEELLQCRYNYECRLQGLLSHDTRLDFEKTILSLKQQIFAQENRLNFVQNELDRYIEEYGHRPSS